MVLEQVPGLNWRQFSCSKRGLALAQEASQRGGRTHSEVRSKSSEIGVEVGDGLDAAEIVLKGNMFIGGVRVFVGEAETEQNARDFKGVVHLRDKGDGAALANENGIVIGSDPRFSGAQYFELAMDGLGKKLSNVFFHELGDLVGILVGDDAR